MARYLDITGQTYGRLYVNKYHGADKHKQAIWECTCDCGKIILVRSGDLRKGHTKSCGCWKSEHRTEMNLTHGKTKTKLHHIWNDMKKRCYNIKSISYPWYGAKGIIVCDEWKNDFSEFYEWAYANGYEEGLTIERLDVTKNYEPINCKFVTKYEQHLNTSRSLFITYKGETKVLSEWCRLLGLRYATIRGRIKVSNWTIEEAFETPTRIR